LEVDPKRKAILWCLLHYLKMCKEFLRSGRACLWIMKLGRWKNWFNSNLAGAACQPLSAHLPGSIGMPSSHLPHALCHVILFYAARLAIKTSLDRHATLHFVAPTTPSLYCHSCWNSTAGRLPRSSTSSAAAMPHHRAGYRTPSPSWSQDTIASPPFPVLGLTSSL
jgi:hypothetical protein